MLVAVKNGNGSALELDHLGFSYTHIFAIFLIGHSAKIKL